ncbi:glycosyltransferase [Providencia rettgeri]|nr:glycosyltransferase [Providencia rettgeri]MDK3009194.1 glycosyltransferase [Providencia rettgeri]
MINLAFFLPDLGGGGAEKVITNLMRYINENDKKINIILFVNKISGPNIKKIPNEIKLIELSSYNIIFSFIKLSSYIKNLNIHYLISTVRGANIAAALSTFIYKKHIWILREANTFTNPNHKKNFKEKIINFFCYITYNRADYIIANSPDTKNDLIRNCFNLKKIDIKVLPNPVMLLSQYRKKVCLKKTSKKLIAVGRLVPQKNFHQLIMAISNLINKGESISLDIYGEGYLNSELKKLIAKLKCQNSIKILPYNENIIECYPEYDLFVSNSKWEGFGNVLVEAMGAGLPVISTNCPGGPQYIFPDDSKMISLVPLDCSIDELSLAIQHALLNRSNYTENDIYNLIQHAKKFSVEVICQQYLDYILNLNK